MSELAHGTSAVRSSPDENLIVCTSSGGVSTTAVTASLSWPLVSSKKVAVVEVVLYRAGLPRLRRCRGLTRLCMCRPNVPVLGKLLLVPCL